MLRTLRFLRLLSIVVWVGGLIFFAFVLAPTAFSILPSQHEAGLVVGASLKVFDGVALVSGGLFLAVTAILFARSAPERRRALEAEFLLAGLMVVATAYLHWRIEPAMELDRQQAGGDINAVAVSNPARIHFETLHKQSEQTDGMVLLLGLAVIFLLSREEKLEVAR
jgi:uncharacterized membrane protein